MLITMLQRADNTLTTFINDPYHATADYVIVVLMGHGGTDSSGQFIELADGGRFYLQELIDKKDKCDNMIGMFMIIVVQACRGGKTLNVWLLNSI